MNDLSNDIVVEQNETTYDRGGNVVLATRYERLHDATGTGPLHGPNGTQPQARRSYLALYHDAIGRHRFSADFGTNGGAELERPETPPRPSDTVLVSETSYAADGQAGCNIGPDGTVAQTTRNRLGETIRTVEALGTVAERTQRFRPDEAEAWNYDEQGNWLAYFKEEDGVNEIDQPRRNNQSNQITMVDGSNAGVAHDKNGNLLRVPTGDALDGPPRHLKWNAWNQLVEVRNESDQLLQRNTYDGLFRRTTRELNDSSVIHCYCNDQWRPVEERLDGSTDPSAIYYWGARYRDDLARRDRDTTGNGTLDESLWCLMDYFDPIAVIDDEGEVVERYTFSAFGNASILAPDYSVRTSSAVNWDFLFHGQFEDAETEWQNYGFRFYVPDLGGWPSRDPIGEKGGVNLYGFVGNNATAKTDYLGLAGCPPCKNCETLDRLCRALANSAYRTRMRTAREKYDAARAEIVRQIEVLISKRPTGTLGIACRAAVDLSSTNLHHLNSTERGLSEVAAEVEYTRDLRDCDDKLIDCAIRRAILRLARKCK